MCDCADEVKTQGHLEPTRCVMTQHQDKTETALYVPCSRVQLARVVVCVIVLVDVVCVMIVVLIAHVDIRAVYARSHFSVVEMNSLQMTKILIHTLNQPSPLL